jgi:ribosome biogenesis GTPase A
MRDTLKSLELDNNPLQSLRGEALQAPDKLWAELERLEAGSERYMKVKLMFVGEGNVGKTTLLEELCKNKSKAEQVCPRCLSPRLCADSASSRWRAPQP